MKLEDITEEWVRNNIDVEAHRKLSETLYDEEPISYFMHYESSISFDEFINRVHKWHDKIKERFDEKTKIEIHREYSFDSEDVHAIKLFRYVIETDNQLIKRLIRNEKRKLTRKKKKKQEEDAELKLYKKLKAKYEK